MNLALNLLEAPDSVRLADFLSRTPNMFNVVILSPHGYFGQKDVLGKPDTGGQVSPIAYDHDASCWQGDLTQLMSGKCGYCNFTVVAVLLYLATSCRLHGLKGMWGAYAGCLQTHTSEV